MTSFSDLGVSAELCHRLDELGATTPSTLQHATLRATLAGHDVCGEAPAGPARTLAFALPVAMTVGRGARGRPRALLLVPDQAAAKRLRWRLDPLLEVTGGRAVSLDGGTTLVREVQRLRNRIDLVVATPNRLEELIQRGAVHLGDVDLVAVDAVEVMADMGLLPVVERLLATTSPTRRTLVFGTDLDGATHDLIRRHQRDPVRHRAGDPAARGEEEHLEPPERRALSRRLRARVVPDRVRTSEPGAA